jgi:hypothetical protein
VLVFVGPVCDLLQRGTPEDGPCSFERGRGHILSSDEGDNLVPFSPPAEPKGRAAMSITTQKKCYLGFAQADLARCLDRESQGRRGVYHRDRKSSKGQAEGTEGSLAALRNQPGEPGSPSPSMGRALLPVLW